MNNQLDTITVEGQVLDGARFPNLYRLLDLGREYSMPAAFEILAAYEADEWKQAKLAEFNAYIEEHNYQPPWSPSSKETFYRWVRECAEREGHPELSPAAIRQLKEAAECVRIVQSKKARTAVQAFPESEDAWRPAYKLLHMGFHDALVATVERAAEIAEAEAKPITQGIMSKARAEIWRTDPQIREWVEQPNQTVDPRSAHDRVVTALNKIRKEANDLRKQIGDNPRAWNEFLAGLAEIQ